jgi:hypothetical protein
MTKQDSQQHPPTDFFVINEDTGLPIQEKSAIGHAIQAVINEGLTVELIRKQLRDKYGLEVDEKRIEEHCRFYTAEAGNRKKPTLSFDEKFKSVRLIDQPPNWRTANPDGSPKAKH